MIQRIQAVYENGTVPPAGFVPLQTAPVPLQWPRGEDGSIVVSVVDQAGDPVNLTGASLALGVRTFPFDADPIFVRAGSVTDAAGGVAAFTLVAADTADLAPGHYRYDVWLVLAGERHQIVPASDFQVLEADTLVSETAGAATAIPPAGAVDTVDTTGATLAAVDSSNLTDGAIVWVRGGAFGKSYWHIEINGNSGGQYPVDATHIDALGLTDGQWVQTATGGTSAGASAVAIDFDNFWETTTTQPNEEIIGVSKYIDFDEEFALSVGSLIPRLTGTAFVTGGIGTVKVRVGGTFGALNGTVRASGTLTATSEAVFTCTGASFAKPSGLQLVQITIQNDTAGQRTALDSPRVSLRGS